MFQNPLAKIHLFYFTAFIQILAFPTKIMVSSSMRIVIAELYVILQQNQTIMTNDSFILVDSVDVTPSEYRQ